MRKILVLILILIVLIALAPGAAGFLFKRNFLNLIDAINHDGRVRVDLISYDEGWLTSDAKLTVTPNTSANGKVQKVTLENHITHGPLVHNPMVGFTSGYGEIQTVINFPNSTNVIGSSEINTIGTFGGWWLNGINISRVVLTDSGFGVMTWEGMNGNVDFKVRGDFLEKFKSKLKIGALVFEAVGAPFKQIIMGPSAYESDRWRLKNQLWGGNSHTSISNIEVKKADGTSMANINDIRINNKAGEESNPDYYDVLSQILLKRLEVFNQLPLITDVNLIFNLQNLSTHGAIEISNAINAMRSKNYSKDNLGNYSNLIPKLFTSASKLIFNLYFNTSMGKFRSDNKLYFAPNTTLTTPEDLWQKSTLVTTVRISIPLFNAIVSNYLTKNEDTQTPPQLPATTSSTDKALDNFKEVVVSLYKKGQMHVESSIKIVGWANQRVPFETFDSNIQTLGLSPNTINQLRQAYQQYQAQLVNQVAAPNLQKIEVQQKAAQQRAKIDMFKQVMNSFITKGYIKVENNEYVINIIYQNRNITINGKPFNPEDIYAPTPALTPTTSPPNTLPAAPVQTN